MDTIGLVQLDRDHPGFRDPAYRARRNRIAALALSHREPEPPPEVPYTEAENGVWTAVLEHLRPLHQRYACRPYLSAWPRAGFDERAIPSFREVNRGLLGTTGFRLSPVAGLVRPRTFLEMLAQRVFLATQYVRHFSAPLYTPEPDVIHEFVGHVPLLHDARFAELNRLFGEAARRADEPTVERLIRVYWYTLEFGLAKTDDGAGYHAVGAGLFSSFGELGRFEQDAEIRPFDIEVIGATPFDPTDYQNVLFCAQSTEALICELEAWLVRV